MELTNIKDLFREKEKYQGRKVTIGGWVRSNRDSKNFGFLVVNDGTFLSRFRSYTAVKCRDLRKQPESAWELLWWRRVQL